MKRLFNYILILSTALMISNQLFANSYKAGAPFKESQTTFQDPTKLVVEFESVSILHQPYFIQKIDKDKIELSENENETEDSQSLYVPRNFNFFENYFYPHSSGNFSTQIQNGLAPCKHILYLETMQSLRIIFCVYRI